MNIIYIYIYMYINIYNIYNIYLQQTEFFLTILTEIRTHNHLVHEQTLNHLAKLAK